MSEDLDKKESDLFEEVGIDTDEAVGADYQKFDDIYTASRIGQSKAIKRRRY